MLIAAAFALGAAAQAAPAVGFRGFLLGQTIDDARRVELPASEYEPNRLHCSDEPGISSFWFSITPEERSAGLLRCIPGNTIGGMFAPASFAVTSGANAQVHLDFVGGKLVSIMTEYNATSAPAIGDALRAKFGAPAQERTENAQTQAGASIEQTVIYWHIGSATIEFRSPYFKINRMAVLYSLPDADAFHAKVSKDAAAKADM